MFPDVSKPFQNTFSNHFSPFSTGDSGTWGHVGTQEVTAILESNVKPEEVILKLKSPGGSADLKSWDHIELLLK